MKKVRAWAERWVGEANGDDDLEDWESPDAVAGDVPRPDEMEDKIE